MNCKACDKEAYRKANPDKEHMMNAITHTCEKSEPIGLGRMIFTDPSKEGEWKNLPDHERNFIMNNLAECMDKTTNKVGLEILCGVVNELIDRIEKLEKYNPTLTIAWNWVSVR